MVSDTRFGSGGFTLIELMLTLALVAIVLGFGVPSMTQLIRSNQVINQTNSVLGGIQLARAEAVKRGVGMAVCGSSDQASCDGQWGQGWLVYEDSDGSGSPTSTNIVRVADGSAEVDNTSGGVVRFDHQGLRRDTSEATVTIKRSACGSEKARQISIARGGRAASEKVSC
ncbi:MAG: GspH/FimT family pseudopilin [Alcanivorax sp.]|uniref:GspH/FimT family pseudopilin n=1 Tax=Alloalcanivorax venustensis TaxID=172371 RepID=UPI001891911B|nr:GspH/FimT family pseudopilin [Alcanivorax sp.]MCH2551720.1 GspH/FimT family pseudopilin [Alcanivorax sp.]MCH9783720.1 GspH/FimT family pseudopilin [Gammaproteobacteria bacterium]MEC8880199.1 GspH/FimT family pseudopilin [Pseudomonadota bacterium]